ncbi:hypothetical protein L1887_55530 [Cichorium endivia]|nr:hypothetical protein L1887_55530 [Cichorium endivia]
MRCLDGHGTLVTTAVKGGEHALGHPHRRPPKHVPADLGQQAEGDGKGNGDLAGKLDHVEKDLGQQRVFEDVETRMRRVQTSVQHAHVGRQTVGGGQIGNATRGQVAHRPVTRLANRDGDHDADGRRQDAVRQSTQAVEQTGLVRSAVQLVVDHIRNHRADDVVHRKVRAEERTRVSLAALHLVEQRARLDAREGLGDQLDLAQRERGRYAEFLFGLARTWVAGGDVALAPEGGEEEEARRDGEGDAAGEVGDERDEPAGPVERHHDELERNGAVEAVEAGELLVHARGQRFALLGVAEQLCAISHHALELGAERGDKELAHDKALSVGERVVAADHAGSLGAGVLVDKVFEHSHAPQRTRVVPVARDEVGGKALELALARGAGERLGTDVPAHVKVVVVDKDGAVEEAADVGELLGVLGKVADLPSHGFADVVESGGLLEGVGGGADGVEGADAVDEQPHVVEAADGVGAAEDLVLHEPLDLFGGGEGGASDALEHATLSVVGELLQRLLCAFGDIVHSRAQRRGIVARRPGAFVESGCDAGEEREEGLAGDGRALLGLGAG